MSYKALYRIYRPQDFNEVAGQTHITTTLKNALANDQVAHAYLFSGPRGTGKTSIAKIFAKAVNCVQAPIDNPCNECDNCLGITSGVISDIIEIDAASNNGVDEIREIRDKVKYLPGYVKYKVYIIDEVHMLSPGAFNALLKTLEEPPAHVIFILCTTEPQKIPLTIQSRCQRFDFKAITTKDIISKLDEIIALENIKIEKKAISQIALYAEGGLRDAISMLDQARAYSPDKISAEDVDQITGAVSSEMQTELAEALIKGNSTEAIEMLNSLISEGKEVRKITFNLIEFFRDMLMIRNLRKLDENNLLYENAKFLELSELISNRKTFYILEILNKVFNEIKWTNSPKIYLELAFIKITDSEVGSEAKIISLVDDLEQRVVDLEKIKNNIDAVNEIATELKLKEIIEEESQDETLQKDILEDIDLGEDKEQEEEFVEEEIDGIKEIENKLCDDVDNTYSILFVENVLNNGNREDKAKLIDEWKRMRRSAHSDEEKHIAQILETGQVVASAIDKIIMTFPSSQICNQLMTTCNKIIAQKVLQNHFGRDIEYMALPEDVFKDITDEFLKMWKQGNKYVKLSKIQCEGLKDVSAIVSEEDNDLQPKVVTDAIDLFGDIVKVKK